MANQSSGAPKASKPQKHPNNIRKAIKQSGLKFYQVAEQTNIPRETLVDYCAGKHPVPQDKLEVLSHVLKFPKSYLVPPFPEIYRFLNLEEQAKDAQALLTLQTHCQNHPTDENALRELMVMLAAHGQSQEIERWYARLVKELSVFTKRGPEPSTTALKEELCTQWARSASSPTFFHVEQASPMQEAREQDPHSDAQAPSAPPERDEALSALPLTADDFSPASSDQKQDSHASPASPTPRPDSGAPTPPPDPKPNTQTPVRNSDKAIIISTPLVQILVRPSPDEIPDGVTPKVLVTSLSFSSEHSASSPSLSISPQDIIDEEPLTAQTILDPMADSPSALKVCGYRWQGQVNICQQQQAYVDKQIRQGSKMNDENTTGTNQITRRETLIALATISAPVLTSMQRERLTPGMIEDFLSEATTSITTCWHLLRGNGIDIVEHALPTYLPVLTGLAKRSSLYRQRASYLAAQGFLLLNHAAYHHLRFTDGIAYCQKAVDYAHESGDLTLLVTCLAELGDAFDTDRQLDESSRTYLRAEGYSKEISGFLYSMILAQSSLPYARQGKSQEVIRCLGEAWTFFEDTDDQTPVFLSGSYGRPITILFEGLSNLHLGDYEQKQNNTDRARKYYGEAVKKLTQKIAPTISVPKRIDVEILNNLALAYAKAGNMTKFEEYFVKGANGSKELGSKKREQEAWDTLLFAMQRWRHERRVMELVGVLR